MSILPGPPRVALVTQAAEAKSEPRLRSPKRSASSRGASARGTRVLSSSTGRGSRTLEAAEPRHSLTLEQAEQLAQEPFLNAEDERRASGNGAGPSHAAHSMPAAHTEKPAWFQGCRVQVQDVSKVFKTRSGTNLAVDGVSLQLEPHSFTAFLGPSGGCSGLIEANGKSLLVYNSNYDFKVPAQAANDLMPRFSNAGKTTFMRLIAGLEDVSTGSIILDGRDATDLPSKERQIGFVFQSYALFKHMTLAENISFGPRMQEMDIDIDRRVEELLEVVELPGQGHKYPKQLSGGQKQRIALARALAANAKLLLMDEPFGALDPTIRASVRTTLAGIIKRVGVTSIMVTHDQEEAFDLADRVIIFNRGRIEQDGTPEEIMREPNSPFVMHFTGDVNQMPSDHQFAQQMGVRTDKPEVMFRPEDVELRTSTPRLEEEAAWCAATVNDGALTENGYKFYLQLTPDMEVEFIRPRVDGEDGSGMYLASSQRVYIRVHPSRFMGYHPSELDSAPV